MKKSYITAICLALFATPMTAQACTSFGLFGNCIKPRFDVSSSLPFARVQGMGFNNDGIFEPGLVFRWDQSDNTLSRLDEVNIELEEKKQNVQPINRISNTNLGLDLSLVPPKFKEVIGSISAKISRNITVEMQEATTRSFLQTKTRLRDYTAVEVQKGNGEAAEELLGARNDDVFIVMVNKLIEVDKLETKVEGDQKSGNTFSFDVDTPVGELVTITGKRNSLHKCHGNDAPCLFDVIIYKAYYAPDLAGMQFKQVFDYQKEDLSVAFRTIY